MSSTFDDLGIPFPLFAGPVSEAREYAGVDRCALCAETAHGFRVGIGGCLIEACPHCGEHTGVYVADEETPCVSCRESIANSRSEEGEVVVCYACLRAGKAALTKDTEYGMIRWEDAVLGRTHGRPGVGAEPSPAHRVFSVGAAGDVTFDPTLPERSETPWERKALPRDVMLELLRTPSYSTWQGEQWLFDGDAPMIYIGPWGQSEFNAHAADGDGQALLRQIVEEPPPGDWADWLGASAGHDGIGVYVFRSQDGKRMAAHYDMD